MAKNKKPRKAYKPRPVRLDNIKYVVDYVSPLVDYYDGRDGVLKLRIELHDAINNLRLGKGEHTDFNRLINATNVAEALVILKVGDEHKSVVDDAQKALKTIGERAFNLKSFTPKASELTAINLLAELHDAQLDVCTLEELDKASQLVRKIIASGKVQRIGNKTTQGQPQSVL
jgi:hypothetical protein